MSKIIGIDLGTTNSAVAIIEGGSPKIVENVEGNRTTPSVVAIAKNGDRIVGLLGKRQAVTNPENTIYGIKRFMGHNFEDPEVQKDLKNASFKIQKSANGGVEVKIGDNWIRPEEISAMILAKIKSDVEAKLGEKITESTSERKPTLKKITEKGVEFRNELDGALHVLSPEESIQIQSNLGSDIAVVLDDVPGLPATKTRLESSLELTLKWAERAKKQFEKITPESVNPGQKLFGVVQGGDREYLRKKSVRALQKIGFDGYGIGGLAIGAVADDPEIMYRVIDFTVPYLEDDKPRHLLGVGYPEQIIKSIALGMDTFDCVIPTRNARHGELFINQKNGNGAGYAALKILNKQYAEDFTPIDNTCSCYGCRHHNRAYLRHLFMSGEPLGIRLATMHNLRFYLDFMENVRRSIEFESFSELLALYQ